MKYKKNKLRLNEVASAMYGFYFLVKFCLVLIYILKVYFKRSSSILLRKKNFNSLLAFFFWKACTFSIFERFLCWKSRNYFQYFSLEIFLWDLFMSSYELLGYYFYIILNVRRVQFGLCSIRLFFSFFLLFLFFCCYFPWQILKVHRLAGKGERITR